MSAIPPSDKLVAFINNFALPHPSCGHKIYITTTLPKLEYCSAVWDPHHVKRRQQLENVQKFAGRVITNNWTSGYELLCSSLGLMKLADRRRTKKLKLCYKIVNNLSCIPSLTLSPHPHPSPRAPNSKQLSLPLARTEAHKQSFFVNVILSGMLCLRKQSLLLHLVYLSIICIDFTLCSCLVMVLFNLVLLCPTLSYFCLLSMYLVLACDSV